MKKLTRERVVPDHLCQSFLRDGRNQVFRFTRLAEFGQQQENPRKRFSLELKS